MIIVVRLTKHLIESHTLVDASDSHLSPYSPPAVIPAVGKRSCRSLRIRLSIWIARSSMCCLLIAMVLPTDDGSEMILPGIACFIGSMIFAFSSLTVGVIALSNAGLVVSTVLILKQGYEGAGCFRSMLVSAGTVIAACLPSIGFTEPRSGYYFWLAAFFLSTTAHWLLYSRSGDLDSNDSPLFH